MRVVNLADEKGAARFGTCAECGNDYAQSSFVFYKVSFTHSSIVLCEECLKSIIKEFKCIIDD